MKHILLALLSLIVLIPAACRDQAVPRAPYIDPVTIIRAGDQSIQTVYVEIADTMQTVTKGLMGRKFMPDHAGMLFVFNAERPRNFWMKDTLIPLDMIFIKSDGTIHHIHENAIPHDETLIPSHGAVLAVLELNGGIARKLDIKIGDKIHHNVFENMR